MYAVRVKKQNFDDALTVFWREHDGLFIVSQFDESGYSLICTTRRTSRDELYEYQIACPDFDVVPGLAVFVLTDLLSALCQLPSDCALEEMDTAATSVVGLYGGTEYTHTYDRDINDGYEPISETYVNVTEEVVNERLEKFPTPPEIPTFPPPSPTAITDPWITKDGMILRVCDMNNHHLRNAARYCMRIKLDLMKAGGYPAGDLKTSLVKIVKDCREPVIREARRRGLILPIKDELKALHAGKC